MQPCMQILPLLPLPLTILLCPEVGHPKNHILELNHACTDSPPTWYHSHGALVLMLLLLLHVLHPGIGVSPQGVHSRVILRGLLWAWLWSPHARLIGGVMGHLIGAAPHATAVLVVRLLIRLVHHLLLPRHHRPLSGHHGIGLSCSISLEREKTNKKKTNSKSHFNHKN